MPELPEMNVQTPLQNTKLVMETASLLKQPSALQALEATLVNIGWLAVKEVYQQESGTEAPQHSPRLTYLPNLQAGLKSHMHSNHKLVYAYSKEGYYSYYLSLLPHIHEGICNAFGACPKFLSK